MVESLEHQDLEHFTSLTILSSDYQRVTTLPGKMPDVVISAWQEIWAMDEQSLGGRRKYIADFEIYDQRVADPNCAVVDI
jgi:predicted transcriptional regulator YdeE